MTTATKKSARKTQARRVTISEPVNGGHAVKMTVGAGETAKHYGYFLHSIPADFGLGFHFEKFAAEQVEGEPSEYDVLIDRERGYHSCTCKGNTYCGHCKHVEAILALIQSGKIAVPALAEKQPEAQREPWCQLCNDDRNVYCPQCAI